MSLFCVDYIVSTMIDDLSRSADSLTSQIFEQLRVTLEQSPGDPLAALKSSESLKKVLDSTQAFGPAVVTAFIVTPNRRIILSAHGALEGSRAPSYPSILLLQHEASSWWTFATIASLPSARVYVAERPVQLDNRPLATVSVGVTTALIADRARHLLEIMLLTAAGLTLATWIAVSLMAKRIVTQVSTITRGFEQLRTDGNGIQLSVSGRDELSTLAEKFNELSSQMRADRIRLASDGNHLFDVVRSIQDAVLLLDSDGAILFANKEARERLVPKAENIEGAALTSVLGPDHSLVSMVRSAMETGSEAHDVTIVLPDGASFLVSFFRLGDGRKPAGLLMVLRNLAPVIELEAALDYSDRLARLGGLISGVAHQLRSPLHGMNLRLELMRSDPNGEIERHIDRLRHDMNRLDQAVEALLRFMRPEELKVSDFDANALVTDLCSHLMSDHTTVEYKLAADLAPVRADRGMVAEALTNLITNAIQAMPNGGVLSLASKSVDSTVELTITDQGVGIDKEKLDQIFTAYYTTKAEGSGLGLPFALRALGLNGGKLDIQSQVDKGTVCKVSLPAAPNSSFKPDTAEIA
jgi:signal transduction histidine kinase